MKAVIPPHGYKVVPELEAWLVQAQAQHGGSLGHPGLVDGVDALEGDPLKVELAKEGHKYAVGRQIACECGAILDCRSAVAFYRYSGQEIKSASVACPAHGQQVIDKARACFEMVERKRGVGVYGKGKEWLEVVDGAKLFRKEQDGHPTASRAPRNVRALGRHLFGKNVGPGGAS